MLRSGRRRCWLTHSRASICPSSAGSPRMAPAVPAGAGESLRQRRLHRFLGAAQGQIPGKLLIIWDGAPIHRSKAVQEYLSGGAAKRLWLERLPGYAPELNPDEGIWRYLKYVELRNLCCRDIGHLREELDQAAARLGDRPDLTGLLRPRSLHLEINAQISMCAWAIPTALCTGRCFTASMSGPEMTTGMAEPSGWRRFPQR